MGKSSIVLPDGSLIFGMGQGLYKMDFKTCKPVKLYENNQGSFTKISKIDNNRFLFAQVGLPEPGIKSFDLKTNKIELIYRGGFSPYYNSIHQKMFFNYIPSYKDGPFLWVGTLKDSVVTSVQKITKGSVYTNDIGVISVSSDEVVFNYRNSNDHIFSYNVVTNKLKTLPITNCDYPQIWRSATKQLMCYDSKNKQYFLTDLSGKKMELVETMPSFKPVLYLSKYDELVFSVNTIVSGHKDGVFVADEKGHLGVYDFKTGRSQIISDEVSLGTGDAAYYPKVD